MGSYRALTADDLLRAFRGDAYQLRTVLPALTVVAGAVVAAEAAEAGLREVWQQPQRIHLAPADGLQVARHQACHYVAPILRRRVYGLGFNPRSLRSLGLCVCVANTVRSWRRSHPLMSARVLHFTAPGTFVRILVKQQLQVCGRPCQASRARSIIAVNEASVSADIPVIHAGEQSRLPHLEGLQ